MTMRILSAGLLLLAMAAPAAARQTAPPDARSNLTVFRDVQQQVLRYPNFTIFDSVSARIEDGVVTLVGLVTMPYKSSDLEKRIARRPGVARVVNQIEVLPVSGFDDDIRIRVARSIYGNPNFWRYASMPNPPIHIIVRNGHVVLEGVVNNEVDRMMARAVANQFGVFSLTNHLRTDAEVEAELEKL